MEIIKIKPKMEKKPKKRGRKPKKEKQLEDKSNSGKCK